MKYSGISLAALKTTACPVVLAALSVSCTSTGASKRDVAGTYFRVPTVHDEPTGRLELAADGRYEFDSILPQSVDSATGSPFHLEEFGTWVQKRQIIVLTSSEGHIKNLGARIELLWSGIRYRK